MIDRRHDDEPITSASERYDQLRNVSPEAPCPYLPGQMSRSEVYQVEQLDGGRYERFMDQGFRRSGRMVYRPRCRGCTECRQLRIPVMEFLPTRGMRRTMRRNADLRVNVGPPEATDEKYGLFCRYLAAQHDGTMPSARESFEEFLYESPADTLEFQYMLGDRLVGVGIADRGPQSLSSVYMYFDPDFGRRSLGTFSALWEIRHCREEGLPYYYLGFYVAGSRTMAYKARFRPNQILVGDDRWVTLNG